MSLRWFLTKQNQEDVFLRILDSCLQQPILSFNEGLRHLANNHLLERETSARAIERHVPRLLDCLGLDLRGGAVLAQLTATWLYPC